MNAALLHFDVFFPKYSTKSTVKACTIHWLTLLDDRGIRFVYREGVITSSATENVNESALQEQEEHTICKRYHKNIIN